MGRGETRSLQAMRITITLSNTKPRKKYAWGDTRMRGNVELILQPRREYDAQGRCIGQHARQGRTLTEWVRKGSARDQNSLNFKP